jgi:hypothetical protein
MRLDEGAWGGMGAFFPRLDLVHFPCAPEYNTMV